MQEEKEKEKEQEEDEEKEMMKISRKKYDDKKCEERGNQEVGMKKK